MASYLLTGGCGFIGSHLCNLLLETGHDVRVLDDLSSGRREILSPNAELIVGDVADPETVRHAMAGMDGCFHLAAIASVQGSIADPEGVSRVNFGGTANVAQAARAVRPHAPIPLVYVSTAAVYGNAHAQPIAETTPLAPISPYGVDKRNSELYLRQCGEQFGLPSMIFRPFNVYGRGQEVHSPYSGVVAIVVQRLLEGSPVTLFGDGQQSRDFVDVADVVRILAAGIQFASVLAPTLNICTGAGTTIRELVHVLAGVLGRDPIIHEQPARPGDIRQSVGDFSAAQAMGLVAKTRLVNGLTGVLRASGAVGQGGAALSHGSTDDDAYTSLRLCLPAASRF